MPEIRGLVVVLVDGDPEFVSGKFQFLRAEIPGPCNGVFFEIIAKGEVAEHLEESVVAGRAADIFKVVVLAGNTQADLCRGGAVISAVFLTGEAFLELDHAGVGEEESGVVRGNKRSGSDDGMTALLKEFEITAAYFFGSEHEGLR